MSARIATICPNCNKKIHVRKEFLGHVIACNHCHASVPTRIPLSCPGCRKQLHLRPQTMGEVVECKHCDEKFTAKISILCPNCQRELGIRAEYLEQAGLCNKCDFQFTFHVPEGQRLLADLVKAGYFVRKNPIQENQSRSDCPTLPDGIISYVEERNLWKQELDDLYLQHKVQSSNSERLAQMQQHIREVAAERDKLLNAHKLATGRINRLVQERHELIEALCIERAERQTTQEELAKSLEQLRADQAEATRKIEQLCAERDRLRSINETAIETNTSFPHEF